MLRPAIALALALATLVGVLPAPAADYEPKIGQPGKDVIWVPTPESLVERMLDMAHVTPQDYLVDLGSGDGRTVIAAARRGVNALGIEYNPDMVALSRANAERAGVADRAQFVQGDVFATDFSRATVVTMYLLPSLNLKLRPTLLAMKPGTRLVSHAFNMGDWPSDETATVNGYTAYLWIVPAKVQGRWLAQGPDGPFELVLEQTYQKIVGKVSAASFAPSLGDPVLEGDQIRFTLVDKTGRFVRFHGTVQGNSMEGTAEAPGSPQARWSARRAE